MKIYRFWLNGDVEIAAAPTDTVRKVLTKALKKAKHAGPVDRYVVYGPLHKMYPLDMPVGDLKLAKDNALMAVPRFSGCYSGKPTRVLTDDEIMLADFFAGVAEADIDYSVGARVHTNQDLQRNRNAIRDAMLQAMRAVGP